MIDSNKIVRIKNTLYAIHLSYRSLVDDSTVFVVRQVEMRTHEYVHPVQGRVSIPRYIYPRMSQKFVVPENDWNRFLNVNVENIPVDRG